MSKKPTWFQRCKAAAKSNARMANLLERRALLKRANRFPHVYLFPEIRTVEADMREELELMET